jgi:hypothetical protein
MASFLAGVRVRPAPRSFAGLPAPTTAQHSQDFPQPSPGFKLELRVNPEPWVDSTKSIRIGFTDSNSSFSIANVIPCSS